jgi:hypothetical protein
VGDEVNATSIFKISDILTDQNSRCCKTAALRKHVESSILLDLPFAPQKV